MDTRRPRIDIAKLFKFMLKWIWIPILCAAIGFAGMYWYASRNRVDTYTARGTMYVYNGNPNVVNYQYTSSSDLNSAVQLMNTYMVVVRSNKVLDVVAERLAPDYPGITSSYIAGTLSMGSVSETGVLQVVCRTRSARMSADICNAVLDVAPAEIIRVVSAGSIEIIDYAAVPLRPDSYSPMRRALTAAATGALLGLAALLLIFMLDYKVSDEKDLTESYTPPVLSSIPREKKADGKPEDYRLTADSSMETTESYAKLRMNLMYTLMGKDRHSVVMTSAVSGDGKSTLSANLAISCAMGGKKVLLIDGDLRRACQRDIFKYSRHHAGLSEVLIGAKTWQEALVPTDMANLSLLPAGHLPPNPAEMLGSERMFALLDELEKAFDLVLIDTPPINIVSDPLALSTHVAGCLFVVRQKYSDHRDIRKALVSAELAGMTVLGFILYGENAASGSYQRYYKHYYKNYQKADAASTAAAGEQATEEERV